MFLPPFDIVFEGHRRRSMSRRLLRLLDVLGRIIEVCQNRCAKAAWRDGFLKACITLDGRSYFVQPYALIYSDNNYYLLAFDNYKKKYHFRVDRMTSVHLHTWTFNAHTLNPKVDIENYTKYTFAMYGDGELVPVEMRFHNKLVSVILDRFGYETPLTPDGANHFIITQPIAVRPQFFAWIFGLGDKAEIIAPVEVRQQMAETLEKTLEVYKEKST